MLKKKLAILIYSLAGGGAEKVVSILLHELQLKYDITLVLMNDTIVYKIPNDIKIVYIEKSNSTENGILKLIKLPYLAWEFKSFCNKNSIDIALSFMYRPNFINIFSKLFGNKSKIILSERNTPSEVYLGKSLQSFIGRNLVKYLYPKADNIIANSNGNKMDLINNFGIDKSKVELIYNPIDIKKVNELSEEEVKDIFFDKFTFINVGRLQKHKNHILLINAFSKIKKDDVQLLIIGDGPMKKYLENLIENLNLQDKIHMLGFKKNPYKYLAKSDCAVFSSNNEGFPNVILEALACDLPVISTDCKSGPREILSLDNNSKILQKNNFELVDYGILCPINDSCVMSNTMKYFMEIKELKKRYSSLAQKRAMEFDKNIIVDRFKNSIGEINTK